MTVRRSVLVISNDPTVRDMLTSLLSGSGFAVSLAASGSEALAIAQANPPDFVLAELFLQDYSGVELKRRIAKASPKSRVVVLSSFTMIRSSDDVLRFGPSDFILDQRELLELLDAGRAGEGAAEAEPAAPAPAMDERLKKCLVDTIDVLVGLLEINDPFFGGNSHITMEYAKAVAEELKLDASMVDEIVVAALLHDIGRIGIKSDILGKKEMTEADFRIIRSHCENGAKILDTIDFPWKVRPIIIHHHERYDGKGYPSGLKGREIPIGARILAVVDAFAAMTANRPYRPALSRTEAVGELHKNVGNQFDPEVVEVFSRVVEQKYYFRGVGTKPKVVALDDETDYLTLLKLKLVNEGFDVMATDNPQEALALIDREKPDLVLSDVVMPSMDGITFLRHMRETAEGPDLPFIFMSGKDDQALRIEALHLGAEDFLVKPVDLQLLAARMRNIIRRDARKKGAALQTPSTGVVGDLNNLGIPEIVQTLHLGLKTACVTVRRPGVEGRIYFENGRIRHCQVGDTKGEEAFYAMLRWDHGPFVISHGQTTTERTIEMDEMQLMMEGMRRMDEERRDGERGT